MPIQLKRAYLDAIRARYQSAPKKGKSAILNEFCATCGYSRKYAIRILRGKVQPRTRKPGPKPKYTAPVVEHLRKLWEVMGGMCSKKMKEALPLWLTFYSEASQETRRLLTAMSPATMDRLLKPLRQQSNQKGLSTTVPAIKSRVPIKLLDGEIKDPGHIEADTVAHCGNSAEGEFASSLTMTDLATGWTENRAVWTKQASGIVAQVEKVEDELPFAVTGFACDNGTEFLNDELYQFWTHRVKPVDFVRRRPYKKNDAAHVEQKNFTHVRALLGYDRIDRPELIPLINEIYRAYWNPLWNYFTPVMKLISKERVGGRIVKKYDRPKTPYQRLLDCDSLTAAQKKTLRERMRTKNPFFLKRELEKKLKQLRTQIDLYKQDKKHEE